MRLTVARCFLLALSFCSTYSAAHSSFRLKHESAHLSGLGMVMGEQALQQNPGRKVSLGGVLGIQLMDAVQRGDYMEVERLLNKGANPNYTPESGISVLHSAVAGDNGRIVALLLSNGANVDGPPGSLAEELGPLQIVASFDARSSAEVLLKAGAPIDRLNSNGHAPLHIAAITGSIQVATLLLNNGAPIHQGSSVSATPLTYAALYGHLSMVRLLLSRGADANLKSNSGSTALHEAAQESFALIVQELLDNGANIDAQNVYEATPLCQAAYLGNRAVIEVLVLNGADKRIEANNKTPRESLCDCINSDDIPDICSVDECENQQRMLDLLA